MSKLILYVEYDWELHIFNMAKVDTPENKWKCIESCIYRKVVPEHLRTNCTKCYSYRLDLQHE